MLEARVGIEEAFLLFIKLFHLFLDLRLYFTFHLVEQLQFILRQLAYLIYFLLTHSARILHVRLKFLNDDLDAPFLKVLLH